MVELNELSFKTLRIVVAMTERNAALPQATNDPEFVAGATYRDIRRELAVTWPEVRDAVQDLRVHAVLQVARFFGRFGPVFVISDYGTAILEALDAGKALPRASRGCSCGDRGCQGRVRCLDRGPSLERPTQA